MSGGNMPPARGAPAPAVRALVSVLLRLPALRTLVVQRWPQGRLRQAVLAGFVRVLYAQMNRTHAVPSGILTPDFELRTPPELRGLGVSEALRGPGAISQVFDVLAEAFEGTEYHVQRVVEAPDGRLVVLALLRGSGSGSGIEVAEPVGIILTLRGGHVARGDMYMRGADALAAAAVRSAAGPG